MNEWHLQDTLSQRFRVHGFEYEGIVYDLVCWELMFPSWGINDKRYRWNEVSVDFIFWNEAIQRILVTELKNHIAAPRVMCAAYCQVLHRTTLFSRDYTPEKLQTAHNECMARSTNERGGIQASRQFAFSEKPEIVPVLMANSITPKAHDLFQQFNTSGWDSLEPVATSYVKMKEWDRLKEIGRDAMRSVEVLVL